MKPQAGYSYYNVYHSLYFTTPNIFSLDIDEYTACAVQYGPPPICNYLNLYLN